MTSGDWLFGIALKVQCVLPAFSMRFQREFDKYKNVGGRVFETSLLRCNDFDMSCFVYYLLLIIVTISG